ERELVHSIEIGLVLEGGDRHPDDREQGDDHEWGEPEVEKDVPPDLPQRPRRGKCTSLSELGGGQHDQGRQRALLYSSGAGLGKGSQTGPPWSLDGPASSAYGGRGMLAGRR